MSEEPSTRYAVKLNNRYLDGSFGTRRDAELMAAVMCDRGMFATVEEMPDDEAEA